MIRASHRVGFPNIAQIYQLGDFNFRSEHSQALDVEGYKLKCRGLPDDEVSPSVGFPKA